MRLLLDTHIWLWSLLEPARLGVRVGTALEDASAELWLSSISVWEFLLLVERGRITVSMDPQRWLDRALDAAPLLEAPVTHEIARASRSVDLSHEDPADRFIVATAKVLELTLVTADARLILCRDVEVLSDR